MRDSWINCQSCGHRYGSWISVCPQCGSKTVGFKQHAGRGKKIAIGAGIAVVAFFAFVFSVAAISLQQQQSNLAPRAQMNDESLSLGSTVQVAKEASQSDTASAGLSSAATQEVAGKEYVPTKIKKSIVNETFIVAAGGYNVYTFSAPKDATDVEVSGNFKSEEGIHVVLEDEYNFNHFKQGVTISYAGDVYYSSGRGQVLNGTIQTPIYDRYTSVRGEPLYLIFDNKRGVTPANVETIMELTYTQYIEK